MSDLLKAALELAAQGIEVFPLDESKKPKIAGGFHSATTDPETIKGWNWNGGGLIGATIPEGQIVIDIDPRNESEKTLRALALMEKKLPPTRIVKTRSGGQHRYYTLPDNHTGSLKHQLGVGIDVKIPGKGYVVVPPSPGYSLVMDIKPSPAPPWLLEEITKEEVEYQEYEPSPPKFFTWEKGTRYGLSVMEKEIEDLRSQQEGGRNNALNKTTFTLAQLSAGGELDEEEAIRQLDEVAHAIGLEDDEIRETIKQGWKAGLKIPRQAPEKEQIPNSSSTSYEQFMEERESVDAGDDFYWLDWQIDEPDPPFYLHPIIPKHAYIIVYGATESSKSMVFVGIAAQSSHRGIKTSVYSLENPSSIDRYRVRRLGPDPSNFRITNQYIDVNDARQLNDLVERNKPGGKGSWKDGAGSDLIIIDTYSHAFNSRSEDGNAKAIEFSRRIRWVMHEVGCTVILLDHTGYQQPFEPRDASAKRQQVDVAIQMEKLGEWEPGKPARATLTNRKSARFGNPFYCVAKIADTSTGGIEIEWEAAGLIPKWEVNA